MPRMRTYFQSTLLLKNVRHAAIQSMSDLLKVFWNKKQLFIWNVATNVIHFKRVSSLIPVLKKEPPSVGCKYILSQRGLSYVFLPSTNLTMTSIDITYRFFKNRFYRLFTTKVQLCTAAENLSQKNTTLAIPKKPIEPDYCCMGGCVECVWDIYAEEMKAWTHHINKNAENNKSCKQVENVIIQNATGTLNLEDIGREQNLESGLLSKGTSPLDGQTISQIKTATVESLSSTSNGSSDPMKEKAKDGGINQQEDNDMMSHLPVEIREFLKLEKRLKSEKQFINEYKS